MGEGFAGRPSSGYPQAKHRFMHFEKVRTVRCRGCAFFGGIGGQSMPLRKPSKLLWRYVLSRVPAVASSSQLAPSGSMKREMTGESRARRLPGHAADVFRKPNERKTKYSSALRARPEFLE